VTTWIAATLWAALALAPAAEPSEPAAAGATISGELTRLDLTRRSIAIKTEGREPREVEAALGAETRIVSRGRLLRPEDLRPGDRVAVVAVEESGTREARVVKVMGRAAIPPPSSTHP